MLKEPDVVRLKRTIPEIPVPAGSLGTIVYVHHADPPGYLVEFPDAVGANGLDANGEDTLGVYSVDAADLELVWREGHWYVADLKPPGNI
jgi:uncharacterized protein DUF4926